MTGDTGVREKNPPPKKKTLGQIGFQSTKSGAGEQFLLLGPRAKALTKEAFLHRHRHDGWYFQIATNGWGM